MAIYLSIARWIDRKERHLLWRDEVGNDFLLLKNGEIYRYSNTEVRALIWNKNKIPNTIIKENSIQTDDNLTVITLPRSRLQELMKMLGIPSKRFDTESTWVKNKEEILAHRIYPHRPLYLHRDEEEN